MVSSPIGSNLLNLAYLLQGRSSPVCACPLTSIKPSLSLLHLAPSPHGRSSPAPFCPWPTVHECFLQAFPGSCRCMLAAGPEEVDVKKIVNNNSNDHFCKSFKQEIVREFAILYVVLHHLIYDNTYLTFFYIYFFLKNFSHDVRDMLWFHIYIALVLNLLTNTNFCIKKLQIIWCSVNKKKMTSIDENKNNALYYKSMQRMILTCDVSTGCGTKATFLAFSLGPTIMPRGRSPKAKQGSMSNTSFGIKDSHTGECPSGGPYFSLPCSPPIMKRMLKIQQTQDCWCPW